MDVENELWELEAGFWTGGVDVYRRSLAGECLMVFPPPVGILNRDQTLEAIEQAPRWRSVTMENRRMIRIRDKTMILAYSASGEREDGGPAYAALAASVYVYCEGAWRLALHQQTPAAA